jgi:hypothetical protein
MSRWQPWEAGMKEFDRVTYDPAVMGSKARIRGMRITVNMIDAGYPARDLGTILRLVRMHQPELLEARHEFFGTG